MKVLWFTNTPSLYNHNVQGYNGGGWISSLEQLMSNQPDIDLAVSFLHSDRNFKIKRGRTTYYPITLYKSKIAKIRHNLFYNKYDTNEVSEYLKVVEDFEPDIIHIFGSEQSFGLISMYTKVPVVIHIQGILSPYLNAMFAPGTSKYDFFRYLTLKSLFFKLKDLKFFTHNTVREQLILSNCKYFMGRTLWDKNIVQLFSRDCVYFHCDEILRSAFYNANSWVNQINESTVLTTTISKSDYKGFDLILKTAKILTDLVGFKFVWKVFGIDEYSFWEKKLKIKSSAVNVHLLGVATSDILISALQSTNIYIHPSYIDNSPNSVCEAQIIGTPIIATNVGGISSLIKDGITGILVPANDPYYLASIIQSLSRDSDLLNDLSISSRVDAMKRHNPDAILAKNMEIYNYIINN